ncbi:MAG: hypothetical protein ACI915_002062 [Gammaproteobacteria bacterium]|jgi:hypothetical protein
MAEFVSLPASEPMAQTKRRRGGPDPLHNRRDQRRPFAVTKLVKAAIPWQIGPAADARRQEFYGLKRHPVGRVSAPTD